MCLNKCMTYFYSVELLLNKYKLQFFHWIETDWLLLMVAVVLRSKASLEEEFYWQKGMIAPSHILSSKTDIILDLQLFSISFHLSLFLSLCLSLFLSFCLSHTFSLTHSLSLFICTSLRHSISSCLSAFRSYKNWTILNVNFLLKYYGG